MGDDELSRKVVHPLRLAPILHPMILPRLLFNVRRDSPSTPLPSMLQVAAACVGKMTDAFPNYKLVVQATLLPGTSTGSGGGGVTMSSAAVWDPAKDVTFTIRWESKEKLVILTIVALPV